jgi:hypothetical protein
VLLAGYGFAGVIVAAAPQVSAERFQSSSYTIDSSVADSFGGDTNATSYKMTSSGGDAIIGDGSAGSYKLGQGYVANLQKSLEIQVQPGNIAGYYGLDENFGTRIYDDSINSADGTLGNTPAWATGKIGTALTFNGTNQSASIPSSTDNNLETVSVSVWIKTTQNPASATPIIQKWSGTGGYPYALMLNNGGTVSFSASDGTNTPTASSGATTINDGQWHLVTGVRTKSGQMKTFIDGSPKNSTTDNTGTSTSSSAIGVANRSGGAAYLNGSVDEVKIFNTALSDKAVANEYAAGNAGIQSSYTFGSLGGLSQTVNASVMVQTDAAGYTLGINQNQNLTSGGNSISAIGGTIASPALWNEGTTNGFGFTVTSGPNLDSKWGTNPNYNYAYVPNAATTFLTRTGYGGGVKDQYGLQFRADVATNQTAGSYSNQITYTATILP